MSVSELHALPPASKCSRNNLLRSLRPNDIELLELILEPVYLEAGRVLYEPGDNVSQVYFPCDSALASFRIMLPDGEHVETALVGREGAIGGVVSHGNLPAFARSVVQAPGRFLKADVSRLEEAKLQSASLQHLFARYADCLLAQVFQATACNAVHSIERRTAKWILFAIDRSGNHEVTLTQEQLAGLLGVGRSYVNRVFRAWKADGLITVQRGKMVINDRRAIERISCDCRDIVTAHFKEVLGGVYPSEGDARAAG
jgi:CRP-like cAMP-binding protein